MEARRGKGDEVSEAALAFDPHELMALESVLTPSEVSTEAQKAQPQSAPTRDLCLKIGSALLQSREQGGEVIMVLTEQEVWLLRERISVFMAIGSRSDVGLSIKLKLYGLLLDYAFAREAGEFETADHEERSAREVKNALATQDHDDHTNPHGAHHRADHQA